MACEIKRFGIQEPKGWDGTHPHPILQETDTNVIETPYYESETEYESDTDNDTRDDYQDTDSDYQSSDDNIVIKRIQNTRGVKIPKNYRIILTDETDYIPE